MFKIAEGKGTWWFASQLFACVTVAAETPNSAFVSGLRVN